MIDDINSASRQIHSSAGIYLQKGRSLLIYEKIKLIRENAQMTQTELAQKLGVTRSAVNSWEMGISTPTIKSLVEFAMLFSISTDYLLGMPSDKTISVDGLTDEEIVSLMSIINCYKKNKNT